MMCYVDIFVLKNKYLSKTENLIIDFVKLCSMVCLITYFFHVSKLYFAIFAFVFEVVNVAVKVLSYFENKSKANIIVVQEEKIEDIIHSSNVEGDAE